MIDKKKLLKLYIDNGFINIAIDKYNEEAFEYIDIKKLFQSMSFLTEEEFLLLYYKLAKKMDSKEIKEKLHYPEPMYQRECDRIKNWILKKFNGQDIES